MKYDVWYMHHPWQIQTVITSSVVTVKKGDVYINPDQYIWMTSIDAVDLEDLFDCLNIRSTNNIGCVSDNVGLLRSMSVGDIAIDDDDNGWVCASSGWRPISKEYVDQLKLRLIK